MCTGVRIPSPDGEVITTYDNSMGLSAKLESSEFGFLIDGEIDVSTVHHAVDYVDYDEAGRAQGAPGDMRMPYGTDLWRRQGYYDWTSSSSPYYGGGNGRLYYIFVGTSKGALDKLNLNYSYDSGVYPELSRRGNVTRHYDNSGYFSFGYDGQNRLTGAYGKTYLYDSAGRLTDYEGVGYSSYEGHAIKKSGYTYDANGNLLTRNGWNHENRLAYVAGPGTDEFYLYDDNGIRVKKTVGGVDTYYPFPHYEVAGSTTIKYYFFGGMRVAMRRNGTLTYLHSDHLGSTVLETNTSGTATANQKYCAYGNRRTASGSTNCVVAATAWSQITPLPVRSMMARG